MATLTIKGHPTRGNEVIALLEMLGGINEQECDGTNSCLWYSIDGLNEITFFTHTFNPDDNKFFTLEQFLEKFPYKVGDKVQHKGATSCGTVYEIKKLTWNNDEIEYIIFPITMPNCTSIDVADNLQPYKEEPIKQKKDLDWHPIDYLEFADNDDTWAEEVELNLGDSYEIQVKDGKTFAVKKKPQYPKTYKACCDILGLNTMANDATGYKHELIIRFQELVIARDAYWKIAGDWKPDWSSECSKYTIRTVRNIVHIDEGYCSNSVLAFPTEEMRDAFFENFKELIEECKELL